MMTNLPKLYADLSTAVHSTSSRTLVLRETLSDIRLQEEQGKGILKDLLLTLKVCLALCICSERETFIGLHNTVQEYLLGALSASHRTRVEATLAAVA